MSSGQKDNRKKKMKRVDKCPVPPPRFTNSPAARQLNLFQREALASSSANPLPYNFDTALRLSSGISGPQALEQSGGDSEWLSSLKAYAALLRSEDSNKDADVVHHPRPMTVHDLHKDLPTIQNIAKNYSDRVKDIMAEMFTQHLVTLSTVEKRVINDMNDRHDEMLARIRAHNAELENTLVAYRAHAAKLDERLRTLQRTNASLRAALHGGRNGRPRTEPPHGVLLEEDAQSSSVDPEQSDPVRIKCRLCGRRNATVLLMPCRHLCLCKRCEAFVNRCPACAKEFLYDVDVNFSG
ncbi:unnamed protein product [Cuscuta epithymum]|uniref:RING-type domain-containing protein n=1 Tax=Cuscuta epithymum TaxID=186058 RepID=A0AAV0ET34_9ASTE|nr:unnamed protein product [Cuscuta epithymum]